MGLLALIGILIFGATFIVWLLSTAPVVGVLLLASPSIAWIVGTRTILYVVSVGMIVFGMSRNIVWAVVGAVIMALILALGVLPI